MRLLLDTHTFIWWFAGNETLIRVRPAGDSGWDNDILISAASAWEIATKYRVRRLRDAKGLAKDITGHIADENFEGLAITVEDAARASALQGPLRDPFDRMLIAQALGRNLVLISLETLFDQYGGSVASGSHLSFVIVDAWPV